MPEQYNWYYDRQKRIARALPLSARSTSAAVRSARLASIWKTARTARAAKPRWQSCMMRSRSRSRRTRRLIGGDLNTNTFDGTTSGLHQAVQRPGAPCQAHGGGRKVRARLPRRQRSSFSYREFSSTEGRAASDAGRQEHAAQAGLADGARHGMRRPWHGLD